MTIYKPESTCCPLQMGTNRYQRTPLKRSLGITLTPSLLTREMHRNATAIKVANHRGIWFVSIVSLLFIFQFYFFYFHIIRHLSVMSLSCSLLFVPMPTWWYVLKQPNVQYSDAGNYPDALAHKLNNRLHGAFVCIGASLRASTTVKRPTLTYMYICIVLAPFNTYYNLQCHRLFFFFYFCFFFVMFLCADWWYTRATHAYWNNNCMLNKQSLVLK